MIVRCLVRRSHECKSDLVKMNSDDELRNDLRSTLTTAKSPRNQRNRDDDRSMPFKRQRLRYLQLYPKDSIHVPEYLYQPIVFDDTTNLSYGIPAVAARFRGFNLGERHLSPWLPENIVEKSRNQINAELRYVYAYLKHEQFTTIEMLQTRKYDHVVYGIFAYVLRWPADVLKRFGREFVGISDLVDRLLLDGYRYPNNTVSYDGEPVNPRIFRLLTWHFVYDLNMIVVGNEGDSMANDNGRDFSRLENNNHVPSPLPLINCKRVVDSEQRTFELDEYVSREWMMHFQHVYEKLTRESWVPGIDDLIFRQARDTLGVPFAKFIADIELGTRTSRPKYITGVACCGKTTLLQTLKHSGWQCWNRGDMGSFAGKSKSPACVASLHAAIDRKLRSGSGYIIGDRGPIDNPLWTAIMPLCDPKYKDSVVSLLARFFKTTFNELVVEYHAEFDVVVFLDQYPSRNRSRMLHRNEGGDAHRGRLHQYVPVQFMAYYMFAAFFGYKIVTVPYDSQTGEFDSKSHYDNALDILKYYGPASLPNHGGTATTVSKLSDEVPKFLTDKSFARAYGIFK